MCLLFYYTRAVTTKILALEVFDDNFYSKVRKNKAFETGTRLSQEELHQSFCEVLISVFQEVLLSSYFGILCVLAFWFCKTGKVLLQRKVTDFLVSDFKTMFDTVGSAVSLDIQ